MANVCVEKCLSSTSEAVGQDFSPGYEAEPSNKLNGCHNLGFSDDLDENLFQPPDRDSVEDDVFTTADSDCSVANRKGSNSSPRSQIHRQDGCSLPFKLVRAHPVWFQPDLGRITVVHLLSNHQPGVFIVRRSSHPGSMALSVKNIPGFGQTVDHYLIESTVAGLRLEGSPHYFRVLPYLIAHYCEHGEELNVKLRLPSPINDARTLDQLSYFARMGTDFWSCPKFSNCNSIDEGGMDNRDLDDKMYASRRLKNRSAESRNQCDNAVIPAETVSNAVTNKGGNSPLSRFCDRMMLKEDPDKSSSISRSWKSGVPKSRSAFDSLNLVPPNTQGKRNVRSVSTSASSSSVTSVVEDPYSLRSPSGLNRERSDLTQDRRSFKLRQLFEAANSVGRKISGSGSSGSAHATPNFPRRNFSESHHGAVVGDYFAPSGIGTFPGSRSMASLSRGDSPGTEPHQVGNFNHQEAQPTWDTPTLTRRKQFQTFKPPSSADSEEILGENSDLGSRTSTLERQPSLSSLETVKEPKSVAEKASSKPTPESPKAVPKQSSTIKSNASNYSHLPPPKPPLPRRQKSDISELLKVPRGGVIPRAVPPTVRKSPSRAADRHKKLHTPPLTKECKSPEGREHSAKSSSRKPVVPNNENFSSTRQAPTNGHVVTCRRTSSRNKDHRKSNAEHRRSAPSLAEVATSFEQEIFSVILKDLREKQVCAEEMAKKQTLSTKGALQTINENLTSLEKRNEESPESIDTNNNQDELHQLDSVVKDKTDAISGSRNPDDPSHSKDQSESFNRGGWSSARYPVSSNHGGSQPYNPRSVYDKRYLHDTYAQQRHYSLDSSRRGSRLPSGSKPAIIKPKPVCPRLNRSLRTNPAKVQSVVPGPGKEGLKTGDDLSTSVSASGEKAESKTANVPKAKGFTRVSKVSTGSQHTFIRAPLLPSASCSDEAEVSQEKSPIPGGGVDYIGKFMNPYVSFKSCSVSSQPKESDYVSLGDLPDDLMPSSFSVYENAPIVSSRNIDDDTRSIRSTVSHAGTIFSEPWDSSCWENLINIAHTIQEPALENVLESTSDAEVSSSPKANAHKGMGQEANDQLFEHSGIPEDRESTSSLDSAADVSIPRSECLVENVEEVADRLRTRTFEEDTQVIVDGDLESCVSKSDSSMPHSPAHLPDGLEWDTRPPASTNFDHMYPQAFADFSACVPSLKSDSSTQGTLESHGKSTLEKASPGNKRKLVTGQNAAVLPEEPEYVVAAGIEDRCVDNISLGHVQTPPRLQALEKANRILDPAIRIQNCVEKLAEQNGIFGSTVRKFINCTCEGQEQNPQIVLRNTRQFINGVKNYLVKHGENGLHELIESERDKLHMNEFLNIDAILEGILHKIILRPLKPQIYKILLRECSRSGTLETLTQNLALVRSKTPNEIGIKGAPVCDATTMECVRSALRKMQYHYSPLKKLEYLLKAVTMAYFNTSELRDKPGKGLPAADELVSWYVLILSRCSTATCDVDAVYMWSLLHPALLNGDASYYLTALSSAIHVLKNIDLLHKLQEHGSPPYATDIMDDVDGFVRVAIPNEAGGSIDYHTFPLLPTMTTAKFCKIIAHKFGITNPEDHGLYLFVCGIESCLLSSEYPGLIKQQLVDRGRQHFFAYKRHDAKIAWPKCAMESSLSGTTSTCA